MLPAAVIIMACCATVILFLYKYTTSTYKYWKMKSVTFAPPVPLFGNIKDHVTLKMTQGECLKNIYKYVYCIMHNLLCTRRNHHCNEYDVRFCQCHPKNSYFRLMIGMTVDNYRFYIIIQ